MDAMCPGVSINSSLFHPQDYLSLGNEAEDPTNEPQWVQAHAGPCPTPGRCGSSTLALESRGFCLHPGTGTRPERPRALTHLPRAPLLREADPVSPGTRGCDVSVPPTPAVPLPVMPPWPSDCFPECCPPTRGLKTCRPGYPGMAGGRKESPLTCGLSAATETKDRLEGCPQDGVESSESASKSKP